MMKNYLQILQDSLVKKLEILTQIEARSHEQAEMLKEDQVSFEAIDRNMDDKARLISEMEALDKGFESLYEKIREELDSHRQEYKEEILSLQALIRKIT
ncbi:MAG: hypothetical protein ACI4DN_07215, partial [Lachnospiraceae bacterium]